MVGKMRRCQQRIREGAGQKSRKSKKCGLTRVQGREAHYEVTSAELTPLRTRETRPLVALGEAFRWKDLREAKEREGPEGRENRDQPSANLGPQAKCRHRPRFAKFHSNTAKLLIYVLL